MSVKQIIKVLLLLAGLVLAGFVMHRSYYPNTIAYELYGPIKPEAIERAGKQFEKPSFQWEMYLGDKTLIMTTGNVQCHQRFSLEQPWFYPAKGEAVLSEAVLSDLFSTGKANRQSFKLLDRRWIAAGSVKEGRFIYIGYDPELLNLAWNKTTFYYAQSDLSSLEIADQERATFMAAYGIGVDNSLYYRDYLYLYYNLALMLLILSLVKLSPALNAWLKTATKSFVSHWRQSDRYTANQKLSGLKHKSLDQLILAAVVCFMALITCIKLLSNLILPRTLMPDNWFSPSSYLKVFGSFLESLNHQLSSGSSVLIFKQGLCLLGLLIWVIILERIMPKSCKIKP